MLRHYLLFHSIITSAPKIYTIHNGINAIGHAMGRDSVMMVAPKGFHFNMYTMGLGKSTLALKSTSQEDVIESTIPKKYLGYKTMTPQGLLRGLTEQPDALWSFGEFQNVLRGVRMGGTGADIKEIMNDLLKCPDNYDKKLAGKGKDDNSYHLVKPYLSVITTVTPEDMIAYITEDMVKSGWLARYVLSYVDVKEQPERPPYDDSWRVVESILSQLMTGLYSYFRSNPAKIYVSKEAELKHKEIVDSWKKNVEYKDILNFVGRYDAYLYSYSGILLVARIIDDFLEEKIKLNQLIKINNINKLNNLNKLRDELSDISIIKNMYSILFSSFSQLEIASIDMEKAGQLLTPSLEYARFLVKFVNEDLTIRKVTNVLVQLNINDKIDWTSLLQRSGLMRDVFKRVIDTLEERHEIEKEYETHPEDHRKDKIWIKRK